MSAAERRKAVLEALCTRRHDTYENLAREFGVSTRTVQRDVEELMCSYPLKTVRGRYGGGVEVEEGFYLTRKTLTPKETELLRRLRTQLEKEDRKTIDGILSRFAPW